jgi:hypothetical protein
MNIYLRTLGFSEMDSKQEKKLIKAGIKNCIEEGYVLRQERFERGAIILRISESTGLYIYGRYEGTKFIYEYYFPFVVGRRITENDELNIERHLDKESFAVVCDEMKTGVTLIFYLQNVMDYLEYIAGQKADSKEILDIDIRSTIERKPILGKKVSLTALSLGGMILLPINRNVKKARNKEAENNRRNLIAAAKNGDEDAIESLTIEDIDTYTQLSHRIMHEDVFTIVDSTFMPCGVECDQYSVIGEILELSSEQNIYTKETIYIMTLECNDLVFTMAVNSADLVGEPAVGRRFKGQIWLQGTIKFTN